MIRKLISTAALVLLTSSLGFGQQTQPNPSHKYRTVMTLSGVGGGFLGGMFVGFAKFDQATYAERKIWTTTLIGGGAGAVGGYFIGRAIDRKRNRIVMVPTLSDRK